MLANITVVSAPPAAFSVNATAIALHGATSTAPMAIIN